MSEASDRAARLAARDAAHTGPVVTLPGVELAYSEITSPVPGVDPLTTVDTGLSVTFTTEGKRPIKLICRIPYAYHSVVGGIVRVELTKADNTVIEQGSHQSAIANQVGPIPVEARLGVLPAGTYTYKARLRNATATAGGKANCFATDHVGTGNSGAPIVPHLEAVLR